MTKFVVYYYEVADEDHLHVGLKVYEAEAKSTGEAIQMASLAAGRQIKAVYVEEE